MGGWTWGAGEPLENAGAKLKLESLRDALEMGPSATARSAYLRSE